MQNSPTPDVTSILTSVQSQISQVAASRDQLQISVNALEVVRRETEQAMTYTRQAIDKYQDGLKGLAENHRGDLTLLQKDMEASSRQDLNALKEETRQQLNQDYKAYQEVLVQAGQLLSTLEQWKPQTQAAMESQQEEWTRFLMTCEEQFSRSVDALPETVRLVLRDAINHLTGMVETVETQQKIDSGTLSILKEGVDQQNDAVLKSLKILYSGQQRHEQQIQEIQQQVHELQEREKKSSSAIVNHLQQVQASLQRLENDMMESRRPWWKRLRQVQPEMPV